MQMKPLIISVLLIACSQQGRGESGKVGQDAGNETDDFNHPDSELSENNSNDGGVVELRGNDVAEESFSDSIVDVGPTYPFCPCVGSDVCCIARDHQELGERCYPDATSCYCTSTSKLVCINAGMQCCVDRCGVICP